MYNRIQSHLKRHYAADRCRLYAVQLKLLDPRIFLISDGRILFKQDAVQRNIDCPYLRFFPEIIIRILRSVSVGKTYRHLRPGGIASGARVVSQKNYVSVTETGHVFDCAVAESDHSLTK